MIFTAFKSSDLWRDDEYEVEINTLSDLEKFQKDNECSLIINFEKKTIEIYDGYRE